MKLKKKKKRASPGWISRHICTVLASFGCCCFFFFFYVSIVFSSYFFVSFCF